MKIRSITCLLEPDLSPETSKMRKTAEFIRIARKSLENAGFEVQTTRLATPPFPTWLTRNNPSALAQMSQLLEEVVASLGFDYLSLGPALPDRLGDYLMIPDAIGATSRCFYASLLTGSAGAISLPAIKASAEVITAAARLSDDGFANLRFATLANVPPSGAFFPAAYHDGEKPAFTLATEAADLAVQAFDNAGTLEQARRNLIDRVEEKASEISLIASSVEDQTGFKFKGIDFTLAPFPETHISIGTALEKLGLPAFGMHGSLAASAFLVDSLDRASFPRTGFNGLMLPVLEDSVLAKRGAEGVLTIKDLLLYSTVCGTGLDTVPIPGDVTAGQITAVLLDLASLAQRLDKPLTARLMPVPGLKAGDHVEYDFAYFASSRVLPLDSAPLSGLLASDEIYSIQPRKP